MILRIDRWGEIVAVFNGDHPCSRPTTHPRRSGRSPSA
jgi:hypothetical protein